MSVLTERVFRWLSLIVIGSLIIIAASASGVGKEQSQQNLHRVVTIDGCQYITSASYGSANTYTHKANCPNHK